MTHFPHPPTLRPDAKASGAVGSLRQATARDVLWGRPLFRAPALPSPSIALDPLPFIAARVTRRQPATTT